MIKYLKVFNEFGPSEVDIDILCSGWNDKFSILSYSGGNDIEYKLLIKGQRSKIELKTEISKDQALQIIENLKLVSVQHPVFSSGRTFHKVSFVKKEIERFKSMKAKKLEDLKYIEESLFYMELYK